MKLRIMLAITTIAIVVAGMFGASAKPGNGPKCPNRGGHTPPACAKFAPADPCTGALINIPGVICIFVPALQ